MKEKDEREIKTASVHPLANNVHSDEGAGPLALKT